MLIMLIIFWKNMVLKDCITWFYHMIICMCVYIYIHIQIQSHDGGILPFCLGCACLCFISFHSLPAMLPSQRLTPHHVELHKECPIYAWKKNRVIFLVLFCFKMQAFQVHVMIISLHPILTGIAIIHSLGTFFHPPYFGDILSDAWKSKWHITH